MTQEELKMVLKALRKCHYYMIDAGLPNQSLLNEVFTASTAIKEALAQPEQEPVKYSDYEPDGVHHNKPPKRTWVRMTNEEIDSYFEDQGWSPSKDYYPVIKAIEAKLKEKNT